jgi:hypothetical protein
VKNKTSKIVRPIPSIKEVSSSGEIYLSWNTALRVPAKSLSRRRLQNTSTKDCYENTTIEVYVQSNRGLVVSDARDMTFTYQIKNFEPTATTIQLIFT